MNAQMIARCQRVALVERHNERARLLVQPRDCETVLDNPMTDQEAMEDLKKGSRCGECGLPLYRHRCVVT